MKDVSRSVTCAAACLGCVSMCRWFWSRTKSLTVLGGTVVDTGPFINFLLHNHSVIYKILIFFFR